MRIAIGGIMHESNTFVRTPTDRAAFAAASLRTGPDILAEWSNAPHEVGGFMEAADRFGYELWPTLMAWAMPGGRVAADALDQLTDELIARLQAAPALDGLLLALHGALVAEGYPDGDGEILRRIRAVLGPDFPLVVTLDHHANVSERMAQESTALVIYKTNPHVDQRERGLQAAALLTRTIRGEVRPTQALAKPPLIVNILHQNTSRDPMRRILEEARRLEERPEILAANVAAGYPYADVPEMGPSVVIVTDGAPSLAEAEAQRLADQLWAVRDQLIIGPPELASEGARGPTSLPDAAEAVRQAKESAERPVVLVDLGDNIGGGSPGDSTFLLQELLAQGADGAVVVIYDPESVQDCLRAGVRQAVRLTVGGKTDDQHGEPVEVRGRVRVLHDGRYEEPEVRHGGRRTHDQGLTAVVEIDGPNTLVLTSHREPPFSLHQLLSLGLQPERQKILVVKAAIAYRAAYEPIAGRIIEVDTPGLTAVNPARFDYRHVRRPLWPLDPLSPA